MRMSGVSVTYGIMALMAQQTETGLRRSAGRRGHRQPDLGPGRRRRPVGDPGRRRQGQGPQGRGGDVIGFGAGEPDFPTPDAIVEAAAAACRDPRNHRYTPTAGLPELREAVAAKTRPRLRLRGHRPPRCWSPTAASRRSPTPSPPCRPGRRGAGAGAVLDDLPRVDRPGRRRAGGGRRPTRRAASGSPSTSSRRLVTPATKVLLFVSPSNPTGAVYPRAEIEAIGRWAVEHGIWVVTDEIYEHLVYGGAEHHSMPVVVPELADRCIVVNGVAKTYAMTGWRVGLDDRSDRRDRGGDQPAVPRDLQRGQRRRSGPRWPRSRATCRRWP